MRMLVTSPQEGDGTLNEITSKRAGRKGLTFEMDYS